MDNLAFIRILAFEILFPRKIAILIKVSCYLDASTTFGNRGALLMLNIFALCFLVCRQCLNAQARHELDLFRINGQQLKQTP